VKHRHSGREADAFRDLRASGIRTRGFRSAPTSALGFPHDSVSIGALHDPDGEVRFQVAHSREEILEQVKGALSEKLGIEESEITEEASFEQDLGADSLDLVEVVMDLEDQFGLKIPDDDARELTTVGKAIDYVIAHQE
jgi:acyl carrier protein